jgi:hypothetical protein
MVSHWVDGSGVVPGIRLALWNVQPGPTIKPEPIIRVTERDYYALPLPRHPLSVGSHKTSHFLADERDRL